MTAYPQQGDLQQPLTTRVTLFFSDEIDLDSITPESIIVRPVGGDAIDGVFSHSSFNAVSFGAKADLADDTTYEVVVVKDGLKDLAQNPIAEQSVVRFSTGAILDEPPSEGGAGGSLSAAGGGAGGSGPGAGSSSGGVGGGMPPRAGAPSTSGASASGAGGMAATPPTSDDASCGCTVPGSAQRQGLAALAALAALSLFRRRRSRRGGAFRARPRILESVLTGAVSRSRSSNRRGSDWASS